MLLQQRQRLFALHAFAIRPIATRCVIKVDDRNDSRDQRNRFAFETFRITAAVPLFMVITNDVFDRIGKVHSSQNVATDCRVNLHLGKFSFGEFAGLVENVFGHRELADVVKQRAGAECLQLLLL